MRPEGEEKINPTHGTQNILWKEKATEAAHGAPESKHEGNWSFLVPSVTAVGKDNSKLLTYSLLLAPISYDSPGPGREMK